MKPWTVSSAGSGKPNEAQATPTRPTDPTTPAQPHHDSTPHHLRRTHPLALILMLTTAVSTSILALTCGLSILVGLTIGLFGGGGAILMVPIFTYLTGLPTSQAVPSSLFIVGLTSFFSVALHARRAPDPATLGSSDATAATGTNSDTPDTTSTENPSSQTPDPRRSGTVRWDVGGVFGILAMIGAFLGGQISPLLGAKTVMVVFAVVMLSSGIGMVRGRRETTPTTGDGPTPWGKILVVALAIGVLSGVVGAGGGFLVVPALALLLGLPMPVAIGTSLLVVGMQSASGFVSHLFTTSLDWPLLGIVATFAMLGTIVGTSIGRRVKASTLQRGFGVFVLVMAVVVILEEFVLA